MIVDLFTTRLRGEECKYLILDNNRVIYPLSMKEGV